MISTTITSSESINSTLLITDTDSLTYQIQTDNVYEDFYADKYLFNFSGYGKESPLYNDENKKVIASKVV